MINVTKASGVKVPFDAGRIRQALLRVKADPRWIEQIIEKVEGELYDEIPTSKIYRIVFDALAQRKKSLAGKYNLKRALLALGPTGFPFELFVAALWAEQGFTTETGRVVKGHCVNHEVDVIAEKDNLHYLTECKFHSLQGKPCDVKHALYVNARFLDIEKQLKTFAAHEGKTHQMWLVTNTRLTTDAVQYGICAGLGLLSWDFPAGDGLRERIDRARLHPVTCLTSLTDKEKRHLLEKALVLCRDLLEKPQLLTEIGVGQARVEQVLEEIAALCSGR